MIVEGDDGPTAGEAGESNGSASTSSEGKPVYLIRANQGHSLEVRSEGDRGRPGFVFD